MNAFLNRGGWRRLLLAACLALPLAAAMAQQRSFPTPEAAVDALADALKADDEAALVALVGEKYRALVVTGDRAEDTALRKRVAEQLAAYRMLSPRGDDRRILMYGTQAWPFAIPLVREGGSWRFASEQGAEELLNRRIGANEREAIRVLYAYLDAQRQYASRDRDGDGVLQFARRIGSSPGKRDGLYWDADEAKGEEPSPFGPLLAEGDGTHQAGAPYHGYHFRILTGQGPHAAGGAYRYVINGRMIAGFGMVAWPADHGRTGVMSFIVNHNGKVFERDLGPNSKATASKMTTFDPGPGWAEARP